MTRWKKTLAGLLVAGSTLTAQAQFGLGPPGVGAQPTRQQPQLTEEQLEAIGKLFNQAKQTVDEGIALAAQRELDAAIEKFDAADAGLIVNRQRLGSLPGIEDPRFEAAYQKALVLRELGYSKEATGAFVQAFTYLNTITDRAKIAPYFVNYGQVTLENENYNEAITIFSQGIGSPGQARNAELWFNKGKAEFAFVKSQQYAPPQQIQEQTESAIQSLDRAIRFNPQYSEAYLERGMARSFLGDFESSFEDFESAATVDPTNTDALARFAEAAFSRGIQESNKRNGQQAAIDRDLQQALNQMSRFLEQVPPLPPGEKAEPDEIKHERVLLQRSAVYMALGDEQGQGSAYYQSALSDANRVIELERDSYEGYLQKAVALRMMGDFEGALEALTETLDRSPNNPNALLRRGIILFRQGEYDGAMADLRTAILYTNSPQGHFWMGLCYAKKNDLRMAIRHYSSAIQASPSFLTARYNRGLAYMKLGRYQQAKRDFAAVLQTNPKNSQARILRDRAANLVSR